MKELKKKTWKTKLNVLILSLFIVYFIYESVIFIYLSGKNDLGYIYPVHHEVFYNRIIYYELAVSKFTHFTFTSVLKIIMYFLQSFSLVEIFFIILAIPLYLNKDNDKVTFKIYKSCFYAFLYKLLITILMLLLAILMYYVEIELAFLIIRLVFFASIIYYIGVLIYFVKREFIG